MSEKYFTYNTGSGAVINKPKIEGDLIINSSTQAVNEPNYIKISNQLFELLSTNGLSEIEKVIIHEAQIASNQKDKNKLKEKLELLSKSALSFVKDVTANILATLVTKSIF